MCCFCLRTVVDRGFMGLTACQTFVKRSLSPWLAMWSVDSYFCFFFCFFFLNLSSVCVSCTCYCFFNCMVCTFCEFIFMFGSPAIYWFLDLIRVLSLKRIWKQADNFSLPPLLNLKLFPTTLLNAFYLPGQAMVSY